MGSPPPRVGKGTTDRWGVTFQVAQFVDKGNERRTPKLVVGRGIEIGGTKDRVERERHKVAHEIALVREGSR